MLLSSFFDLRDKFNVERFRMWAAKPQADLRLRCLCYKTPLVAADIQSNLVISKSKGFAKILRDIRTSTYQTYEMEGNINRTTTFYK